MSSTLIHYTWIILASLICKLPLQLSVYVYIHRYRYIDICLSRYIVFRIVNLYAHRKQVYQL